jgi:AcrR family transcriptional regulator
MAKKAAKKAPKPVKDPKTALLEAALDLAARQGWAQTMLADIAREAGLSLAELYEQIEDKSDILVLFGRLIDKKTLEACAEPDPSVSARDQLFDVLMERFEVLNEYRDALVSILDSFKTDPKQLIISCPHLGRSMSWMLEAAGIETDGLRGALKVAGLTALYIKTLHVWQDDESADLAKVMAALDKDLGRAERFANTLGF